jgi:hypothetical protein
MYVCLEKQEDIYLFNFWLACKLILEVFLVLIFLFDI